jgi:acyl carrier protein
VSSPLKAHIRAVLKTAVNLQNGVEALGDDADLHAAGLTSHATVSLMLALEEAFDIEFPDRLLRRRTFSSIDAIADALAGIGVHDEAA